MVISFHHFKLFKEFHYENTFGKDEKLKKEYNDYINMNAYISESNGSVKN